MSPEEARVVLLRAFSATGEVPIEWLALLAQQMQAPPRKPLWRRIFRW